MSATDDVHAICNLFAARLFCLDSKDWGEYGRLHTEDVVSQTWDDLPDGHRTGIQDGGGTVVGREALVASVRAALDTPVRVTTVHHGHNPQIHLDAPDGARAVWAMEDRLWWSLGERTEWLHGWGHYHEEYRRVGGHWLISRRRLTRIRVESTPGYFDYLGVER